MPDAQPWINRVVGGGGDRREVCARSWAMTCISTRTRARRSGSRSSSSVLQLPSGGDYSSGADGLRITDEVEDAGLVECAEIRGVSSAVPLLEIGMHSRMSVVAFPIVLIVMA